VGNRLSDSCHLPPRLFFRNNLCGLPS
jgi:hypothetical protein